MKRLLVLLFVSATCLQAQTKPFNPKDCDHAIWKHVYNPERLIVKRICVTLTGTIVDATHGKRKDGVRKEADGDSHGWLRLDPGQEQYINAGNTKAEEGNLVFEIVCIFPVTQADAKAACKNWKSKIVLPPLGAHVRMTGSWVQDTNHQKWLELHPVFSWEVIP